MLRPGTTPRGRNFPLSLGEQNTQFVDDEKDDDGVSERASNIVVLGGYFID